MVCVESWNSDSCRVQRASIVVVVVFGVYSVVFGVYSVVCSGARARV